MSSEEWTLDDIRRFLLWALAGLVCLGAFAYLGDWGIWRLRVSRGGGMGSVHVGRMVVAPMKGGKEEYYPDGAEDVDCSQSLFPQEGYKACWWVRRDPVVLER